eukprot:TRINITY_DN22508_c0_g1_i1.p1 TRINITY_DN22508_c0_g1~~TRINITY_DN22508_c0_g1_i1.p1  ORF type:complete len:553 (+),score=142.96 TRINITY_DN22508_c0_g1_i1:90-1661(+)
MSARTKQEQRKKDFKKGISLEDSRRKREDSSFELRKSKREELQQKRRNFDSAGEASDDNKTVTTAALSSLANYVAQLNSESPDAVQEACVYIRKLLSIEHQPPIQATIDAGVVPRLVQLLGATQKPTIQFEAAWALTNIASGTSDQTQAVVEHGAVPVFIELLNSGSSDDELRDQAVWALGNIAGDSARLRDLCLHNGMMPAVLSVLAAGGKASLLRNATWSISNLCRAKPQPAFATVATALPTLRQLLDASDPEIVVDACWALSYLSDGSNETIQVVINSGVVPKVLEHLKSGSHNVQTPALRTIGNIITGSDEQTQFVINLGVLPLLSNLLRSARKALRKEAAWTLSNITAGNVAQCQQVIDHGLMAPLIALLQGSEFDVRKEAAYAISNAVLFKQAPQISHIVAAGAVPAMCELLVIKDVKMINIVLEFVDCVLATGLAVTKGMPHKPNPYCTVFEEAGAVELIEELQQHENVEIYEKVVKILETYFAAEEIDENTPVNLNNPQQYAFGFGSTQPTTFAF